MEILKILFRYCLVPFDLLVYASFWYYFWWILTVSFYIHLNFGQRSEQATILAVKSTMEVLPCPNVKFKVLLTSFSPKDTDLLGISIFIPIAKFWCFHGDIQRDGLRTTKNWYSTRSHCLYVWTNWLNTICNVKTNVRFAKSYFVSDIVHTLNLSDAMLQKTEKNWNTCMLCGR